MAHVYYSHHPNDIVYLAEEKDVSPDDTYPLYVM
jgi:hypothetical protein